MKIGGKVTRVPAPEGMSRTVGHVSWRYMPDGSVIAQKWPRRRPNAENNPVTAEYVARWDMAQTWVKDPLPSELQIATTRTKNTAFYTRDLLVSSMYGNTISWGEWGWRAAHFPPPPPPTTPSDMIKGITLSADVTFGSTPIPPTKIPGLELTLPASTTAYPALITLVLIEFSGHGSPDIMLDGTLITSGAKDDGNSDGYGTSTISNYPVTIPGDSMDHTIDGALHAQGSTATTIVKGTGAWCTCLSAIYTPGPSP